MMKLLDINKLNKFWDILGNKNFCISQLYGNKESERDVFVRRVSNLIHKGMVVINMEEQSDWVFNGKQINIRKPNLHNFIGISHINTRFGSKIRLQFVDINSSGITLDFNQLLDIQYKFLNQEELEVYNEYVKILYEPTEKEDVVFIAKGTKLIAIKKILREYNILNKFDLKECAKYAKVLDLYLPLGNTGRFDGIKYDKDKLFNIINDNEPN